MIDCGDTNTCAIPMWFQYAILVIAWVLFLVKACWPRDPYDRM